jgi:Na+/glutamate symporter
VLLLLDTVQSALMLHYAYVVLVSTFGQDYWDKVVLLVELTGVFRGC